MASAAGATCVTPGSAAVVSTWSSGNVTRAEPTFQLIEVYGRNYYRTLREKLGWGGDLQKRMTKPE